MSATLRLNVLEAARFGLLLLLAIVMFFGGMLLIGNDATPISQVTVVQLWGCAFMFGGLGLFTIL
jgi:hypothetical protein